MVVSVWLTQAKVCTRVNGLTRGCKSLHTGVNGLTRGCESRRVSKVQVRIHTKIQGFKSVDGSP